MQRDGERDVYSDNQSDVVVVGGTYMAFGGTGDGGDGWFNGGDGNGYADGGGGGGKVYFKCTT